MSTGTGKRCGGARTARLLAGGLLLCLACRPGPAPQPGAATTSAPAGGAGDARVPVLVSIPPQAELVERIGAPHVRAEVLVGPGQNPHAYEPTPAQLAAASRARLYFTIGLPFEGGLVPRLRAGFPELGIVDTQAGIPLRRIEAHAHDADEHDHQHEHGAESADAAGGDDPHTWLNPQFFKIQARTVAAALERSDPGHGEDYRRNLAECEAALDALDARLRAVLAPLRGRELFVYHPAFGYFADAYGLVQVPVEIGGREPAPREVAALIRRAREAGARVIFVQPQFSTRSAEVIAQEIGGAVVPLDDLARDYFASMERMAEAVRQGLEGR